MHLPALLVGLRKPRGQSLVLGCVFLLVFAAYSTLQGLASQLYGSVLASNILLTLYAVFTAACFPAPVVCLRLGVRRTAFCGCLCYAALCIASLLLARWSRAAWVRPLCVFCGGVVGVGAALLWTAQGTMMLAWGSDGQMGSVFSTFWSAFNCSAVFGGLLTYAYFSRNSSAAAPVGLFVLFTVLVLVGSLGIWLLQPLTQAVSGSQAPSWREEAAATARMFFSLEGSLLAPFYFYTGAGQPYQLNTFGNRVFDARTLGLQIAAFYGAEVVSAWGAGRLLDSSTCGRRAIQRQLALFAATTGLAYALALRTELSVKHGAQTPLHGASLAGPSIAFVLWGASDAQAQALAYWRIQRTSGEKSFAREVGFYKCAQSAGWCVGFALSPVERLSPLAQLYATAVLGLLSSALMLTRLPPAGSRRPEEAADEMLHALLAETEGEEPIDYR